MTNDPTSSESNPNPSSPLRRIKIGSQRKEEAGAATQAPAPIPPIPAKAAPESMPGTSADALPATAVVSTETPSDSAQSEATGDASVDASANESAGANAAAIARVTGSNVAGSSVDTASGAESSDPDVDVNALLFSRDDDLENEIAMAMGDGIDDLMAGQLTGPASGTEIVLDERYTAKVAKILRDTVLLELPGQQDGVVPLKQFTENPEVGAELEVVVTGFSQDDQLYELMVPGASVSVANWDDLAEGVVVEAKITGHNKGGLECEVNHIRGFIPASQISLYRIEDFSTFVDDKLMCVVTEANPERRNLVLSHRAILEREKAEAKEKTLAELEVGQTREGTVTRLHNFGAFVDLGGIDGLIHISQLSWDNIRHPSEVVEEGQRVKVRVEKIDPASGKIGLAYRDLMHHPWEGIETKYSVGSVVTGTVSKIMDFGAFVRLEAGIEGLVHISELSHKRINRVSQIVEEGQTIEVKIVSIDEDAQRISMSMKQAMQDSAATSQDAEEPDLPKHEPKRPIQSLKGGTGKSSGGGQFGLKW